jgi:hypothetical protein
MILLARPGGTRHPAVVLQPGHEALHLPAAVIAPQRPPILRLGPDSVGSVRRDELDPQAASSVSRHRSHRLLSPTSRAGSAAGKQLARVGSTSVTSSGEALATAPFFAMTKLPSTKRSERSRCPRSRQSSAKA